LKPLFLGVGILFFGALAAVRLPAQPQAESKPETVQQLLACMETKAAQLESYDVMEEDDPDAKPARYKLYFKQPNLVRLDTADGQVAVQPDGQIRGRKGRGLFGRISVKLRRDDPRLINTQGIPFWDSYFAATVARIQSQIKAGAATTLTVTPEAYKLELHCDQCVWSYVIDPETLFFIETSRAEKGGRTAVIRYSAFHPNVVLETRRFQF
jgi:hypothetical protein